LVKILNSLVKINFFKLFLAENQILYQFYNEAAQNHQIH
jgi:hypothetical protein